jgi:hypothetical protein
VLAVKSNATGSETVLFADFTNFRTFTIQHEIIPVISKSVKRTKASIMRFFFDIKAKRTPSIVRKLFSKRSEHIRENENYFRSEANTLDSKTAVFKAKANLSDSKKIIFEAKRTHYIERKLFLKRSEHIR